jgi:pimeloyl-ACP methyl ester carboxylesterase
VPIPDRHYELVSTVTDDAVKLHGIYQSGGVTPQTMLDAAVIMHGLAGNFYGSSLNLRLGDALHALGIAIVCGNNRGHDHISSSPVSGRATSIGAALEIVDDCRHDLGAWVQFLVRRGHQRILLVGHSLGAIKSLYFAARQPPGRLAGIVALSATRLSHSRFLESSGAATFQKWIREAEQRIALGRGDELMRVDFPFPTWMTASSYRDKYGPEDRYDWLPLLPKAGCPVLLLFGERELASNPAFHGLRDSVAGATRHLPDVETEIVPGADHFYSGVNQQVTERMGSWILRRFK